MQTFITFTKRISISSSIVFISVNCLLLPNAMSNSILSESEVVKIALDSDRDSTLSTSDEDEFVPYTR